LVRLFSLYFIVAEKLSTSLFNSTGCDCGILGFMKPLTIILIIVAILGLGGTGFLYMERQSLVVENGDLQGEIKGSEKEITDLKDEKTKIETELAVLKTIDLEKEAELLRFKIKNAESDLAAAEKKSIKLETNLSKTKPYADALDAIDHFFSGPMTEANLKNIDVKISALGDSQITAQWKEAKADIDVSRGSWGVNGISHTFFLIISEIRGLAS